MTEKKNLKRRSAAVALAVVGVAGLTMAAAAQLNLTWAGTFQAGATTVEADCQPDSEEISVSFADPTFTQGATGVPWAVEAVAFSGINERCEDRSYEVAYKVGSGNWVRLVEDGTVPGSTISVSLPVGLNPYTIDQFALTIHG